MNREERRAQKLKKMFSRVCDPGFYRVSFLKDKIDLTEVKNDELDMTNVIEIQGKEKFRIEGTSPYDSVVRRYEIPKVQG